MFFYALFEIGISESEMNDKIELNTTFEDFDWLVGQMETFLDLNQETFRRTGSYLETVEVRNVLCHWTARSSGIILRPLTKRACFIRSPSAS
jgi:hypothetical protein